MMRSRSVLLVVVLSALFAVPASARTGYLALVPDGSSAGTYIAGLDTATNSETELFEAGNAMRGVAVAPDGRTAYVVGRGVQNLIPVDLTKSPLAAGTPLALGADATSIAIAPDGRTAYVAAQASDQVIVVDLSGPAPAKAGTIGVGHSPHGLAFTPDGTRAFVANFADGT